MTDFRNTGIPFAWEGGGDCPGRRHRSSGGGKHGENRPEARQILKERGCRVTLVNMRFVKPLDTGLLDQLAEDHSLFVTLEENVKSGGFGEAVLAGRRQRKEKWPPVQVIAIEDQFVPQGSIPELLRRLGWTRRQWQTGRTGGLRRVKRRTGEKNERTLGCTVGGTGAGGFPRRPKP